MNTDTANGLDSTALAAGIIVIVAIFVHISMSFMFQGSVQF
jgi:hypothetical protein